MAIYLIVLGFTSVLWAVLGVLGFDGARRGKAYLILCGTMMSLVMGLRHYSVGTDTLQYWIAFDRIDGRGLQSLQSERYEPLYTLFNLVVGIFTNNEGVFLLIESSVTILLISRFIFNNSNHIALSMIVFQLCYLYCTAFNLSRAYLAIAIALQGFTVRSNIGWKNFIPVVLACFVHSSSIVMVLFLGLLKFKNKISDFSVIALFFAFVFAGILASPLLHIFVTLFPKYAIYINIVNVRSESLGIMQLFVPALVLASLLLSTNKESENYGTIRALSVIVLSGVFFTLVGSVSGVAQRLTQYSYLFLIILIPLIDGESKWGRLVSTGGIVFLLAYYLNQLNVNSSEISPYLMWIN